MHARARARVRASRLLRVVLATGPFPLGAPGSCGRRWNERSLEACVDIVPESVLTKKMRANGNRALWESFSQQGHHGFHGSTPAPELIGLGDTVTLRVPLSAQHVAALSRPPD
eukprot:gene5579-biopygen16261